MVEDRITQPDEEPPCPPVRKPGSERRERSARFPGWFYPAALAALGWTIVLVGFFAAKTSVVPAVAAALAALAALLGAILGVIKPDVARLPPISARVTQGLVIAILVADLGVSTGWAGWSSYRANRAVDVLSKITIAGNNDVRPSGGPAVLDVPVTARRDGIVLVFRVADHSGDIGNCGPYTQLVVTPRSGGNSAAPVHTSPSRPVRVRLSPGTTRLHLDVAVVNTRSDRNCGVDLSVTSAKLEND